MTFTESKVGLPRGSSVCTANVERSAASDEPRNIEMGFKRAAQVPGFDGCAGSEAVVGTATGTVLTGLKIEPGATLAAAVASGATRGADGADANGAADDGVPFTKGFLGDSNFGR